MPGWMRWTPEMDAKIRTLAPAMTAHEIAAHLGVTHESLWRRLHKLGIRPLSRGESKEPDQDLWVHYATRAAERNQVDAASLLAGRADAETVRARREAWRDLLANHPNYSLSGLGRTSGFCRFTIMHGLRKLEAGA